MQRQSDLHDVDPNSARRSTSAESQRGQLGLAGADGSTNNGSGWAIVRVLTGCQPVGGAMPDSRRRARPRAVIQSVVQAGLSVVRIMTVANTACRAAPASCS